LNIIFIPAVQAQDDPESYLVRLSGKDMVVEFDKRSGTPRQSGVNQMPI
jgi:hypothetical protein